MKLDHETQSNGHLLPKNNGTGDTHLGQPVLYKARENNWFSRSIALDLGTTCVIQSPRK